MSKRPAVGSIPLCCNASVKVDEHLIKNKIFSYSMDKTWEDVLKDLLEEYKAFKCKKNKHYFKGGLRMCKILQLYIARINMWFLA